MGDEQEDGRALPRCPCWPSVRDYGVMGEVRGGPGCPDSERQPDVGSEKAVPQPIGCLVPALSS